VVFFVALHFFPEIVLLLSKYFLRYLPVGLIDRWLEARASERASERNADNDDGDSARSKKIDHPMDHRSRRHASQLFADRYRQDSISDNDERP